MPACPAFDPLGPYVSSVVSYIECQGLTIGEAGYRAMGAGSPFGMALTGLLTIYVALIGYRLLLGGGVTVRESVFTALRIGFILALTTQWSAYRVLVFDWVTQVPEAAASGLSGSAGIASADNSGIATRVDLVNGAIVGLIETQAKAPVTPPVTQIQLPGQPPAPPQVAQQQAAQTPPGSEAMQWASGLLSITALAGLLSVRIAMALLLALGPGFIAAMLFETTRGLFVGWVRVLAGTFFAAIAVPVVLNLQLAVVEPQVLALRSVVGTSTPIGALPVQLLGTTAFFALVLIAVLAAMARAGMAFRLPERPLADLLRLPSAPSAPLLPAPAWAMAGGGLNAEPNRAQRIADAAQSQDWREARMAALAQAPQRTAMPRDDSGASDTARGQAPLPLGQEGRRTSRRQSPTASHRDGIA